MIENLRKDLPIFEFVGNEINVSGRSYSNDPVEEWGGFLTNVRNVVQTKKELQVNFMLDGISSSNSLYLTNLFSIFNEYRIKCKIKINWYYIEEDEDMEFLGEHYQERNPKLKIELKTRK